MLLADNLKVPGETQILVKHTCTNSLNLDTRAYFLLLFFFYVHAQRSKNVMSCSNKVELHGFHTLVAGVFSHLMKN